MDILSPEQLEALINSSAKDELKRAVKLLFKKGTSLRFVHGTRITLSSLVATTTEPSSSTC